MGRLESSANWEISKIHRLLISLSRFRMPRARKRKTETDSAKLYRFVSENAGVSIQGIVDQLGWNRRKVNRLLTALEKKGQITRKVYATTQTAIEASREEPSKRISNQFAMLAAYKDRLSHREKELFQECVSAQVEGDAIKAKLYANQCAEMRRMIKLVGGFEEMLSQLGTQRD